MSKSQSRYTLVIACAIFFSLGLATGALGPVLPDLAVNNHTDLAGVGAIFTGIFLGALMGQIFTGQLSDRIGQRPILFGGALLLALGTFGFVSSRWLPLTLLMTFLAGLGHGAVDLSAHVLIARTFAKRSVSALNLLNLFFGVGAFVGPAVASLSLTWWKSGVPALWLAGGLLVLQALFVLGIPLTKQETALTKAAEKQANGLYRTPILWFLGALLMVYVGIENGIGGWSATYMTRTTTFSLQQAALVTSGFWMALTAGRLVSTFIGARLPSYQVLLISLSGGVLGCLLTVFSAGSAFVAVAGFLFSGFSFGAVYPTTIAVVTEMFSNNPGRATGVAASMGSVGGMILPWMQGFLLGKISPFASVLFSLAGTLVMMFLFFNIRRQAARITTPADQNALARGQLML